MSRHYLKRGDTLPSIVSELRDGRGAPVNLTGASVKFVYRSAAAGGATVQRTATVVDAGRSIVRYDFVSGDTLTAGTYKAEWEVTFDGGAKLTFPNDSFIELVVVADLNN